VPLHVVAPDVQVQPGVVHVACVSEPHGVTVPVHGDDDQVHPWFEHDVGSLSWSQSVIVPVHTVVPELQVQPLPHAAWLVKEAHGSAVPAHVPPRPESLGV
jgi:hypothetical protein